MRILFLIIIMSCTNVKVLKPKQETTKTPKPLFELKSKTIELRPGKVKYIQISTTLSDGTYNVNCISRNIPFTVKSSKASFYLIESYFSKLNAETCTFLGKNLFTLTKKHFPYKAEKLNVDKKRVFLSKADLAIVIKEREIKKNIYKNSKDFLLFDKPFIRPLNSFVTSYYGNKRLFNNKKQSQHLGNDLRAAVGVKIPSTNMGRVVYAGKLFYTGNVVVIDHGLEIFSVYGHLSKINVTKGDFVQQGDIIGLAGATGRVSGPHLHWGIRMQGQWIDGFSLVEESQKQFN